MHTARKSWLLLLLLLFLLLPSFALANGGEISGVAWYDITGDQTYEAGDRTLGRVTVVLYRQENGGEKHVGKITTGTDGVFAFTGLAAGEYRMSVTLPDEHNFVAPKAGGSVIMPACGTVSTSQTITLGENEIINNAHVGVSKASTYIKAYVFSDDNANGGRRATEEMMRYIPTELLYEYNGEWIVVSSVKTDKDGCATYWELTPGVYRVAVNLPDPYIVGPLGEKMTAWYNCIPPADSNYGVSEPLEAPRSGSLGIGIGAVKTGRLAGNIWYDANCNGVQDQGEMAFQGATVELNNAVAGVSRKLMTGADGKYTFEKLLEGEYTLTVSLPDSYMFTLPGGESLFTDAAFSQSVQATVTMENTTQMQKIGVMPVTTLAVSVYNDANYNGVREADETPFAGATLELLQGETVAVQVQSNGAGVAYVPILRGGEWTVRCTLPGEQVFTVAGSDNDFVALNGQSSISFVYDVAHGMANNLSAGATVAAGISGRLFNDNNVSGVMDQNEGGLMGFTVQAIDKNGAVAAQTVTDENGLYAFESLLPAEHTIRFLLEEAYVFSEYAEVSAQVRNQVIEQTAEYGVVESISLAPGQMIKHVDGGAFRSATVSGQLLLSAGKAAEQLSGGIENVYVQLLTEEGVPVSETTETYSEEDGSFYLKGALPGIYRLEITLPAGYAFVEPLLDNEVYVTEAFALDTAMDLQLGVLQAVPMASLNGSLYYDGNVNGQFDLDAETTLGGITVVMVNTDYDMTYETRTLESGEFNFGMLRPGAYQMTVSLPEGMGFAVDASSLLKATTESTAQNSFVLLAGEQLQNSNIAAITPAQLYGVVHFDLMNDNRLDAEDYGAADVKMTLQSVNGVHSYTVATDAEGNFAFDPIVPGDYRLLVSLTSDCVPSDDNPAVLTDGFYVSTVRVEDGSYTETTYAVLRYAEISGRVYSTDGSLAGVADRTITLYDENGVQLKQTQTDASGAYSFGNIKPGHYVLSCDLPGDNYLFARTQDAVDLPSVITRDTCTVENGVGMSALIPVAMGENKDTCHIGIGAMGKLGDTAWLDENKNGLQDAGEKGLPGVVVALYQYGEKVAETVTDGYGRYLFTDLFPGAYEIEVTMPAEVRTTEQRTDYPLLASVLPESKETVVRAEGVIVPSGKRNLNCDLGFVLRKDGKYPASMNDLPQTDWDYDKK